VCFISVERTVDGRKSLISVLEEVDLVLKIN